MWVKGLALCENTRVGGVVIMDLCVLGLAFSEAHGEKRWLARCSEFKKPNILRKRMRGKKVESRKACSVNSQTDPSSDSNCCPMEFELAILGN